MLRSVAQDDFSAGIWRGEKGPANAVYDAENMLINDDGHLVTRGNTVRSGSPLVSGADVLVGHAAGYTQAGHRVLSWSDAARLYEHGSGTKYTIHSSRQFQHYGRIAGLGGMLAIPTSSGTVPAVLYGGSRKSTYSTGTITVTNGSKTVTGAGTLWSANVDVGMILDAGGKFGLVQSVDSNTQVTLTKPWAGSTAAGIGYILGPYKEVQSIAGLTGTPVVAAAARRLLIASGDKLYYSAVNDPLNIGGENYHELLDGYTTVAVQGIGNAAYWFTTGGTFLVDNLDLDPLDDFGNVQHTVRKINDLATYTKGEPGIATWAGGIVVPGRTDIWLVRPGEAPVTLTEGWRREYWARVQAGAVFGQAAIYKNHYFLPVLETSTSSTVLSVWVSRLDRGFAWTRMGSTVGSPRAFAAHDNALTGIDTQYSLTATTVLSAAGVALMSDNGSVPYSGVVKSRDFAAHSFHRSFWKRARIRASGTSSTPTVSWSPSAEHSSYTAATNVSANLPERQYVYAIDQREVRLSVSISKSSFPMRLYQIELFARPTGRA